MPFSVLTPLPASTNTIPTIFTLPPDDPDMSSHPSSPANRLRLHASPNAASKAARDSIISSSAKGWSPLTIQKRGDASPTPSNSSSPNPGLVSPAPAHAAADGPRRTSNSFKHVNRNSLVSNSPFKNTATVQGAQAARLDTGSSSSRRDVIHERRSPGRAMGQTPPPATGVAATPRKAIGLGIGIDKSKPRLPSGSAVAGQRRVSSGSKGSFGDRRPSLEKSKENESPDSRSSRKPRQSAALKGLKEHSYVSRSPFLADRSMESESVPCPSTSRVQADPASPSPRRTSGGRSASGSRSIRTSPTPSPPRHFSNSTSLGAGPSPLRGTTLGPPRLSDERSPSPTPGKSAMTPSRRLLGPRHALDSPSKQTKTVTFQSVPDVKEFELLSDGDASFEMRSPESEWVDEVEGEGDDSLDQIMGAGLDQAMGGMTITSFDSPELEHDAELESTTANFLMEQGIFTPEPSSSSTVPSHDVPDVPELPTSDAAISSASSSSAPYLSTPSMGGSVSLEPIFSERDDAGIPYGRTHRAERNAAAHSLPPIETVSPLEQPELPASGDHTMLLNANAAQPGLPVSSEPHPEVNNALPHAHQVGPMFDPFITPQTVTAVVAPPAERSEGGVPLGRTSHAERINAARQLATQTIGLGYPRRPARAPAPVEEKEVEADADLQSESGSEIDSGSEDDERFFSPRSASRDAREARAAREREELRANEEEKRKAEGGGVGKQPPPPLPVDVPAPVLLGAREQNLPLSLPAISTTSPFFAHSPAFDEQPRIPSNDPSERSTLPSDDDRPLTPPPVVLKSATAPGKTGSPHRLPSLEFEEIRFTSEVPEMKRAEVRANPHSPTKTRFDALPMMSSPTKTATAEVGEGHATKVRQRISRDKIRETINRKQADGSLSGRPTSMSMGPSASWASTAASFASTSTVASATALSEKRSSGLGYTTSVQPPALSVALSPTLPSAPKPRPNSMMLGASIPAQAGILLGRPTSAPVLAGDGAGVSRNKALPMPPAASPMLKSATDAPAPVPRPAMRPRSNTQAAAERIQLADGSEPRSALDSIISGDMPAVVENNGGSRASVISPTRARPVSILLNGQKTSVGPTQGPVASGPSGALALPVRGSSRGTAPEAKAVRSAEGIEEGAQAQAQGSAQPSGGRTQKQRNVSGISLVSTGSRMSRRSLSMSDATAAQGEMPVPGRKPRLTLGLGEEKHSMADTFKEELESINGERNYKIRERHVRPQSYVSQVSHPKAGDIERGKAWRALRRPSDNNEHAAQLRALKQADAGSATGTIFVKVLGIESLAIPIPAEPTAFQITLDNGIDYIRTPYMQLQEGARVNQEFALVEQPNFSFSLALDIRKDPHIIRAMQEQEQLARALPLPNPHPILKGSTSSVRQPSLALPMGHVKSASGGLKSLFTSPRKKSTAPTPFGPRGQSPAGTPSPSILSRAPPPPQFQQQQSPARAPRETIATYFPSATSSTVGKTHIAFKPIARQCEAKVLEIRYPMFAMFKGEPDKRREGAPAPTAAQNQARKQVAKVTLQIFRLPPLPGISPDELPQCIDECLRGMRHHAWHECEYHEGLLTQEGGDCTYPRRRMFKLVGGNMIASNEVTGKEWAKIDLRYALDVVDLNPDTANLSPASRVTRRMREMDDEGYVVARPNSFKVEFADGEVITFSADTAEAKAAWMEALQGLLGRIPENKLWAELLATRLREREARVQMRSASRSTMASTAGTGHSHSGHSHAVQGLAGAGAPPGTGRQSAQSVQRTRSRDVQFDERPRGPGPGHGHGHGAAGMRRDVSHGDDVLGGRKGEGVV